MITRDRALLARLATVNRTLGGVVSDLMAHQDDGQLPGPRLRELADALRQVADDMRARADELTGATDTSSRTADE
ncbi:hypothetical protein [Saccharomonospora halophila]|uniref:hypothetical protein n=1 Tax=Saccharomonospora halophila TaxID=129922 RepID=UPI00036B70FF|nr:hypothetical protein [Saccharomonospora halophila]